MEKTNYGIPTVKTREELDNYEGTARQVYVEDECMAYYLDSEDNWTKVDADTKLSMSLLEINRQVVSQLDDMDETALKDLRDTIDATCPGEYYLMYGREVSYFTLFIARDSDKPSQTLGDMVLECLKCFENVKTFCVTEDGKAIEIWATLDGIVTVLYLFDYKEGVVFYDR